MKWKIGDMVHGFRVNSMSHIEEVNSDAYLMEHVKSGARLMYLDNDDDNKVFYICFRTTRTIPREHPISWNIPPSAAPGNIR